MSSASSPSPRPSVDGNDQITEEKKKHEEKKEEEETRLSPMEFRAYNRLADHMEMFVSAIYLPNIPVKKKRKTEIPF